MKAAICYERNQPVRVEDVSLDAPRRDEVRVRLAASGVCHSDLSLVTGILPGRLPCVLGHEGAGVVEEIGEGVTHLARGDKVVLSWVTPCSRCFYCRLGKPNLCELGERINKTNRMPDGKLYRARMDYRRYTQAPAWTFVPIKPHVDEILFLSLDVEPGEWKDQVVFLPL